MEIAFPLLSDATLIKLADDINRQGYAVVEDCIPADALASMRIDVERAVAGAGGQYVVFTGRDNIPLPYLRDLATSDTFTHACKSLYTKGSGKTAPPAVFYQVLRCLSGSRGLRESYIFHYDSYVITVLVPIIIPVTGKTGDLIMLPNSRRLRSSYLGNLIDKFLLDNAVSQFLLRKLILSDIIRSVKIKLVPGNAYVFWGCRSIHANEPCDVEAIRATALYHYVDPHADSWLRKALKRSS